MQNTEPQTFLGFEDSHTITDYFKPSKKFALHSKRERKRNSIQFSIFGWLVQNRPKQDCKIVTLPKNMILSVYSYLKIFEIMVFSKTCFYFYECAKTIWNDPDFLGQLETDKLTHAELDKIFEKGSRLSHVRQLKNIYKGKNLRASRERIKLKIRKFNSRPIKQGSGNLLEIFEVSPKSHRSSAFLLDTHLQEIIKSSFQSLLQMRLVSCTFLRRFAEIGNCLHLNTLAITHNSYFSSEDLRTICKCCTKIEFLDISACEALDQVLFKHISRLSELSELVLRNYQQSFSNLQSVEALKKLKELDIEGSCIMDSEALDLLKHLRSLRKFNLSGCRLLKDSFLLSASRYKENVQLVVNRNCFSQEALAAYQCTS